MEHFISAPMADELDDQLAQTMFGFLVPMLAIAWPTAHRGSSTGCASSDGLTIFGKSAIAESLCKDLKIRDWVCDSL